MCSQPITLITIPTSHLIPRHHFSHSPLTCHHPLIVTPLTILPLLNHPHLPTHTPLILFPFTPF